VKTLRLQLHSSALRDQSRTISLQASNDNFVVKREAVTNATVTFSVTCNAVAPPRHLNAVLRAVGRDGQAFLNIPVRVTIHPLIQVAPPNIELVDVADGRRRTATFIVWRPDGHALGDLVEYESPDGIEVRDCDSGLSKRRRFELVDSRAETQQERFPIAMRFADCSEPAMVRVFTNLGRD
jgi:hypothetical protein